MSEGEKGKPLLTLFFGKGTREESNPPIGTGEQYVSYTPVSRTKEIGSWPILNTLKKLLLALISPAFS